MAKGRGDSKLAVAGALTLVLAVAGVLLVKEPLRSLRPVGTGLEIKHTTGEQLVRARLWEDPVAAVQRVVREVGTSSAPTGIVAIREDSVYPAQYHNNLLFADFNFGQLHRIVLGGVGLTDLSSHTIACDCGKGGLLAVMHGLNVPGQDGYIYVSNVSGSIFRVVSP